MAKLIRDNIAVEILKNNSGRVAILDDYDQMVGALNNKIIEETLELTEELDRSELDKDNIIEEAADVIEVVYAICSFHNIDISDVYDMMIAKRKIKGKFLSFSVLLSD